MITVYVRKEEAKVYNALLLDALTVHDFKLQVHVYTCTCTSLHMCIHMSIHVFAVGLL